MTVVEDYLEKIAPPERAELKRIQKIVKTTVPEAEEVITYGMPGFKYKGRYLISFCAFKNHLSIFPGSEPVGALKNKLKSNITGKGTIQFTLEKPLDEDVITGIAELCKARVDTK